MHAVFPIHFIFLVIIMKLTDTMEDIKSMNMALKGVESRQEVIPRTTHQMQADGNVCRRARVLSGLKVNLCVQQQAENDLLQRDVIIRRSEMPLIVQRQCRRDAKIRDAAITHESSPREHCEGKRRNSFLYVTNQNLKETKSLEEELGRGRQPASENNNIGVVIVCN
jgi:hypothetical protein